MRYVAVADKTNDHKMYIYNVQRKKMLLDIASGGNMVTAIQWSKKANDLRFVAVNTQNIQFWNPADASKKLFRPGTFGGGGKFKPTAFNCATFDDDGICYSGGKDGGVYIWD
jgi:WD40 repeat protein